MFEISLIALFSTFVSFIALFLSLTIFYKVFQENYKKPWLFISISIMFLALAKIGIFLKGFFGLILFSSDITEYIILAFEFISISLLTYATLLEYLILKFYKGKFVKFKFIPVQEGSVGGELDIDVSKSNSYLAYKKDKKFLYKQFSNATKKGFEGFLLSEENPKHIRETYTLEKTPIAYISQIKTDISSQYLKDSLDSNSDIVDPINLNNIISFIDNFLEQSSNPFIMIDLDLILKINSFQINLEFFKYISAKIKNVEGILILNINRDIITTQELETLKILFLNLE